MIDTPDPGYSVVYQGFLMKINQDGKIDYEKRFTFETGGDGCRRVELFEDRVIAICTSGASST